MRSLFPLFIFAFLAGSLSAQPDYHRFSVTQVKLTFPDHSVTAEVRPAKKKFTAALTRNYWWYSANQLHTTQGGFSGKLLHGAYLDTYPNKNIREQGTFTNGLKSGTWTNWQESGTIKSRVHYRDGDKDGEFQLFDADGTLSESGTYVKGWLHGKRMVYSRDGKSQVTYYKKGVAYIPEKKTSFLKRLWPFRHSSAGTNVTKKPASPNR